MIPTKANKSERKEYLAIHYKLQNYYRKHNRYIPFKYIQRKIIQKWQLHCYEKNNQININEAKGTFIRWSENLEQIQLFETSTEI